MQQPQNKVKVKPAWRSGFLRLTRNGQPFTTAAKLSGVGKDRVLQEFRKDPEFEREYQESRPAR